MDVVTHNGIILLEGIDFEIVRPPNEDDLRPKMKIPLQQVSVIQYFTTNYHAVYVPIPKEKFLKKCVRTIKPIPIAPPIFDKHTFMNPGSYDLGKLDIVDGKPQFPDFVVAGFNIHTKTSGFWVEKRRDP